MTIYRISRGEDIATVEIGMPESPIFVDGQEIGRQCAEGYRLGGPARSVEGIMRIVAHHLWGREAAGGGGWDEVWDEVEYGQLENTATVMDYDSGRTLDGDASDELVNESAKADPTGAVPAYCEAGWWHYVQPSQVERMRRLGHEVRTVYVDR